MPKLSIVLPVYNVSAYLKQSLECLIHQTLKDIEIICVDDGSSDDSVDIIKTFIDRDSRVKLLMNKHSYAGGARNAGLDISQSDYIMFLDPDDYYETDMCEVLYNKILKDKTDITICGIYELFPKSIKYTPPSSIRKINNLFNNKIFSIDDIGDDIWFFLVYPYNKIYKKSFLTKNNIRFQTIQNTNDASFAFESLIAADKISLLNKAYYYYRRLRPNNIRLTKGNSLECVIQAYEYAYNRCKNYPNFSKVELGFKSVIIINLAWHLHTYCSNYDIKHENFYNYIKALLNKEFLNNSVLMQKLKKSNFCQYCISNLVLQNDYKNFTKKLNKKNLIKIVLRNSKYILKFLFIPIYSHYCNFNKEKYFILGIPVYVEKIIDNKIKKYILGIKISESSL